MPIHWSKSTQKMDCGESVERQIPEATMYNQSINQSIRCIARRLGQTALGMEPLAIAYLMYSFILYYYSTSIHHFSRQLHIEHLMPTLIRTIGPLAMQYTLYLKQQKASGIR